MDVKEIDDWCKAQTEKIRVSVSELIEAEVSLEDPELRCLVGQSQAFARMRSYISGARKTK